jgi:putative inorganic carbon (hco3(-)) transporter
MRDVLLLLVVFGALPIILVRPYVGVLVWCWLGYMNPHRLTWGFAYDLPLAFVVALTTLVAIVLSNERKRIPVTWLTSLWIVFVMWMGVTTIFAIYPAEAWIQYEKVLKIQLMTLATVLLMGSRERLRMLIWVIVISLGYYGVKGGVFTIINRGDYHVWGPPDSFVQGNNELALALLMILPLMHYLRTTSPNKWIRLGLLVSMILCAFSIVGSQSRGALVGGIAMTLFLWLKAKRKLVTGAILVVMLPLLIAFMPTQWYERMQTIETYEADESAMGRIETWKMALRLANDKLMGGGFELWTDETFDRYTPQKTNSHDAHSIYFKVLGEHGWVGLVLFICIGLSAWRTGAKIVRQTRHQPELEWLSSLARMIQVSLAAYATGGAFLGLSYFDLYWHLVAMLVIGAEMVRQYEPHAAGRAISSGSSLSPQYANNSASRQ